MAQWFERWSLERDSRGLASVKDDRGRFKVHIEPALGHLPMRDVDRRDIEVLVGELDGKVREGKLAWKTAANVWMVVTKMFNDARSAKPATRLRCRDDSPCDGVQAPDQGDNRANSANPLPPAALVEQRAQASVARSSRTRPAARA
jgi:hypothetical protein